MFFVYNDILDECIQDILLYLISLRVKSGLLKTTMKGLLKKEHRHHFSIKYCIIDLHLFYFHMNIIETHKLNSKQIKRCLWERLQ